MKSKTTLLAAINPIRTLAILFILFIHFYEANFLNFSGIINDTGSLANLPADKFLILSLPLILTKGATIYFFIISGYLFEFKRNTYASFGRLMYNKWVSLLRPYCIVFLLPLIFYLLILSLWSPINHPLSTICTEVLRKIFSSSAWFIPALFVFFIVNYFTPSKYLVRLMWVSLFYTIASGINIHLGVVPVMSHEINFGGFLFTFLLGRYFWIRPKLLNLLSNNALILLILCSFLLSFIETYKMFYDLAPGGAFNTLKLSNINFAIFSFIGLARLFEKRTALFGKIKMNTYFLYLLHPFTNLILSAGRAIIIKKNDFG
ncbi:MAG: acyltransferase family protein, partial [Chitinophagaceae bacterium]|nr:acyltransferase family protein [Chitinophagaceae bacterium]